MILNYDLSKLHGWLFIDKPVGVSSFKAVSTIKKYLNLPKTHKIGHGGTLDPFAEGVLPIAIGEATKTVEYVMNSDKVYEFTILFGSKTDTKDCEGNIIKTTDVIPTKENLIKILKDFTGTILQKPPSFSAIKINGERAYSLARKGVDVDIPMRKVNIHSLELKDFNDSFQKATLVAKVSKGTYIRCLAEDIAEKLGSLGHTVYLRRTEICIHKEKLLLSLNTLYNEEYNIYDNLISIEDMLDGISAFSLNIAQAKDILNGNLSSLSLSFDGVFKSLYNGKVLALLENKNGKTSFLRVFNNNRANIGV
ncbi:MAG: tRNA pseudouridine(55) synthase TruB [Alphaproteobacteria bacterium]|jgi:tRNA pseudouridine55 synthase|nr:tRNA pseudouridine(55) synthase TruB [Alphaproteobacteria bacterium]